MNRVHRLAVTVVAVGAAILGGTLAAHAGQQSAADDQPSLVEDFSYPNAAAIAAANNVVLVSGDGHILFADCATPVTDNISVIEVRSSDNVGAKHDGLVCFKVTARPKAEITAYVTMSRPWPRSSSTRCASDHSRLRTYDRPVARTVATLLAVLGPSPTSNRKT